MKKQLTNPNRPVTLCEEDLRTVAAGSDLATVIAGMDTEEVRAARQEACDSFESFNQKTSAMFNTLSTISKIVKTSY